MRSFRHGQCCTYDRRRCLLLLLRRPEPIQLPFTAGTTPKRGLYAAAATRSDVKRADGSGGAVACAMALLRQDVLHGVHVNSVGTTRTPPDTDALMRDVDCGGSPLTVPVRWVLAYHRDHQTQQAHATSSADAARTGVELWMAARRNEMSVAMNIGKGWRQSHLPFVIVPLPSDVVGLTEVSLAFAHHFLAAPSPTEARNRWQAYQQSHPRQRDSPAPMETTRHPGGLPTRQKTQSGRGRRRAGTPTPPAPHEEGAAVKAAVEEPAFYWRQFTDTGAFVGYAMPCLAMAPPEVLSEAGDDKVGSALRAALRPVMSPFWLPRMLVTMLPHFALPPPYASANVLSRMSHSQRVRLSLFAAPLYSTAQLRDIRRKIQTALKEAEALRRAATTAAKQSSVLASDVETRVEALLAPLPKVLAADNGNSLSRHLLHGSPPSPSSPSAAQYAESQPCQPVSQPEQGQEDDEEEAFMNLLLAGDSSTSAVATSDPAALSDVIDEQMHASRRAHLPPQQLANFWARGGCAPDRLPYSMYFPAALYPYLLAVFRRRYARYISSDPSREGAAFQIGRSFRRHAPLSDMALTQTVARGALELADALAVVSQRVENTQCTVSAGVDGTRLPRHYGALYASTEEILKDMLFAIACELGEAHASQDYALNDEPMSHLPQRRTRAFPVVYASYDPAAQAAQSIFVLGLEYINASGLAIHGIVDSTLCAEHGVPLDENGFPMSNAFRLTRTVLQCGDDVFVPGSGPSSQHGDDVSLCASSSSSSSSSSANHYSGLWRQYSQATRRALSEGAPVDHSEASASKTTEDNMWLRTMHDLQDNVVSRSHAATSLFRFRSSQEQKTAMVRQTARCRLRFSSPYWLNTRTLASRWGVEHVKGEAIHIGADAYVNAEQTTDASRFGAMQCAPTRVHQVLSLVGLHTCSEETCQALDTLLAEVAKERGGDHVLQETRFWVAMDVVQRAHWSLPRDAVAADIDTAGLHMARHVRRELETILRDPTRDTSEAHVRGTSATEPPRVLRIVHAADIPARDEVAFVLSYKPTILVDKVTSLDPVDSGFAEWRRSAEAVQAAAEAAYQASLHGGSALPGHSDRCEAGTHPLPSTSTRQPKRQRRNAHTTRTSAPTSFQASAPSAVAHQRARLEHAQLMCTRYHVAAMVKKKRAHAAQAFGQPVNLDTSTRIALALAALGHPRSTHCRDQQVWLSSEFLSAEPLLSLKPESTGVSTAMPLPRVEMTISLYTFASPQQIVRRKITVCHACDVVWPETAETRDAAQAEQLRWVALSF